MNMTIQNENIRSLLDRYYAGESTLDEERRLRQLLADAPAEFDADRRMLQALDTDVKAPEALRKAVMGRIAVESSKRTRRPWRTALPYAAAVALLLAVGLPFALHKEPARQQLTDEQMRQEAIAAISLLTKTVRKGCQAVEMAETQTARAQQKLENTLNTII